MQVGRTSEQEQLRSSEQDQLRSLVGMTVTRGFDGVLGKVSALVPVSCVVIIMIIIGWADGDSEDMHVMKCRAKASSESVPRHIPLCVSHCVCVFSVYAVDYAAVTEEGGGLTRTFLCHGYSATVCLP